MKRIATLLLVLLVFRLIPVGGPVAATTVRALGLDGLVATADRIVAGTVIGSEAYWTPDGKLILTRHRIAVDETLKGPPSGEVEVTTVGGTVGDVTLHVSGMAAFRDGERTVVFIESSDGYSTVVGLAQGKFSVGGDGRAANDLGGLDFIGPVNPGPFVIDYALFRSLILERVRPF